MISREPGFALRQSSTSTRIPLRVYVPAHDAVMLNALSAFGSDGILQAMRLKASKEKPSMSISHIPAVHMNTVGSILPATDTMWIPTLASSVTAANITSQMLGTRVRLRALCRLFHNHSLTSNLSRNILVNGGFQCLWKDFWIFEAGPVVYLGSRSIRSVWR